MRINSGLNKTEIYDDDSTFRDKHLVKEYFDIDESRVMSMSRSGSHTCTPVDLVNCVDYVTFGFAASNKKILTIRKYPKIIEFLGEVGGTSELIYIALAVLYFIVMCNRHEKYEK